MTVIIFLAVLAILILVHEFGHFIVAKKSGIRVDEFGLGFPPKIFGKKWGNTLYTLNAIPFGGFVKIFGEDQHLENISDADKSASFYYKPKWIQSAVLIAGVTFNILFAWLLISLGFMIGLPSPVDYSGFGKVSNTQLIITEVLPNSPAERAGLKSGDTVVSVQSGRINLSGEILNPDNVKHTISESKVENIQIVYKRGNDLPQTLVATPDFNIVPGKRAIGIGMDMVGILKLPIHLAFLEGARTTISLTKTTAMGLLKFLGNTVIFKSDLSQVSGPIGIASVVGDAAHLGFVYLLSLIAVISINLAIVNLLPFPALDGGRLFFILIEVIIRRPIPPNFARWVNIIGFGFLIILTAIITSHDIFKLL
ncbi:MAG: M50 family metallopeptidase [Minisyncoccia bacterium]